MWIDPNLEFDVSAESVQRLAMPERMQRSEGIGFSSCGKVLAIATADTNTVYLFRRDANGRFEAAPYWSISGPNSGLDYPHDVSFASSGDEELLAVAQRGGSIVIYRKKAADEGFGSEPAFAICGPETRLKFSDGVAFVPPDNEHLAACNLESATISFYRKTSSSPLRFDLQPAAELRHRSLAHPDGLAFSSCGRWLAVANHGNHSVSIFRRRARASSRGEVEYGPEPVTVIRDPGLRHPHSVAFSPETSHLVVTNAGANYFSVYGPSRRVFKTRWSQAPVLRKVVGSDAEFRKVNARNKMEGGPKGIAVHRGSLAICSPEHGVKIYSIREAGGALRH